VALQHNYFEFEHPNCFSMLVSRRTRARKFLSRLTNTFWWS